MTFLKRAFALLITAPMLVAVTATSSSEAAAITTAFDGALTCTTAGDGVRTCAGIVNVPDAQALPLDPGTVPIDVNLYFPAAPVGGADGPWPIIGEFHGWGGSKLSNASPWLSQGYAYFSVSDRGWGMSCGGMDQKRLNPTSGCRNGYNHLMDTRYEVHDVQHLLGLLVDDGLVDPDAIGVTGSSYGGGISMALAALNDRVMPPAYEAGGTLQPWTSPAGTPLHIAAAAPDIPWSDLAYSLVPNGRTLDYVEDAPYTGPDGDFPIGVMKQSFDSGLYGTGLALSNYSPTGTNPDADLNTWYSLLTGGEPYDDNPQAADIIEEVMTHHSSYYIDDSHEPAPLHISNGFTDDLFPVDEAVRFYNKTIARWPDANIYLYFSDHGHQRGQNKAADVALRRASINAWFAHFLKGQGAEPANGVSVLTQNCGGASEGPFSADSWAALPKSEIVFKGGSTAAMIAPQAGNPQTNQAYDPIAGGGACATAPGADQQGLASYRLPAAPTGGFTLAGSPTIIADILNVSPNSQLAYRLVDVAPDGNGTLVARGLYRPDLNLDNVAKRAVFQMHPNAYVFEEGHVAKLELMPNDAPYGRVSNGQGVITVSNLELRLPILEPVGTAGSTAPAPKVVPEGYELAPDYVPAGPIDTDGDGINDEQDDCPGQPGPASGTPGENGCPVAPLDTDGDGVADPNDACPNDVGPVSNGGCPLDDTDQDGIPDTSDDCPTQPGPASGTAGQNGCPVAPPPDADNDTIPDGSDACPDDAGPASTSGCPDGDSDDVADTQDLCPDDAGPVASSGCPNTDGDALHDGLDQCDAQPGPAENAGCPETVPDPGTCRDHMKRGTNGPDTITGAALPERIVGKRGDDRLRGRGGDDCVVGNLGSDRIRGGDGDDRVSGGADDDRVFSGAGNDTILGGKGRDRLYGGSGDDVIRARDGQRDVIECGSGDDSVIADRFDMLRGCEDVRRR